MTIQAIEVGRSEVGNRRHQQGHRELAWVEKDLGVIDGIDGVPGVTNGGGNHGRALQPGAGREGHMSSPWPKTAPVSQS